MQATTAQLYPGRDTFEFDQGHVSKNQPITENVAIIIIFFGVDVSFYLLVSRNSGTQLDTISFSALYISVSLNSRVGRNMNYGVFKISRRPTQVTGYFKHLRRVQSLLICFLFHESNHYFEGDK